MEPRERGRATFVAGILLAGYIFASCCAIAHAGELRAGAGRAIITPEHDMWLSGYASRTAPSEGKVHDLFAKALVFEDETGAKTVIVTTDLIGLTAAITSGTARMVEERFGVARERQLYTASHTHCGPVLKNNLEAMYGLDENQARIVADYTSALPGKILAAVAEAMNNVEPVSVSWSVGHAEFAANRRRYTPDGVQFGVNPIGPVDRDVPVLAIRRPGGPIKALLMGYACHNTTLDFQQICGDYAGFAQAHVEAALPGTVALFMSGCGADANPEPRRTLEWAQQHGKELGEAVLKAAQATASAVHGPIRAVYREIPLELSAPPTRDELERQAAGDDVYIARRARTLLEQWDAAGGLATTHPYAIQVLQFADSLQLTALAGEVVVDYSLRLKHELGKQNHYVIGYANDVPAYIPSLRILREGGYEAETSMIYYGLYGPWAPSIEEKIVSAVIEMSKEQ